MTKAARAFHVVSRVADQRVLASTPVELRTLSGCMWPPRAAGGVLAFRCADTHVHALVVTDRRTAGRYAHDAECSLRFGLDLPVPFDRAHIEPIRDQAHLRNTLFYCLGQHRRHGLASDPLHDGSNLLELLGLRVDGGSCRETLSRVLPRVRRSDLVRALAEEAGVPLSALDPTAPAARAGLAHLAEAAASAVRVPQLGGRGAAVRSGRVAATHVAFRWVGGAEVARLLGVTPRTVRKLRHEQPDPEIVLATLRQLHLRAHLPVVGGGTTPHPRTEGRR